MIWDAYSIPLVAGVNTITVTATDSTGNTASDTIQVHRVADTTPPTIVFTYRVDGATGISPNTSVVVTFSEDMDTTTINSTNLRIMGSRDNPVFSHVFYDVPNQQALIIPQVGLAYGATYTAAVTTGATDAVGNSLMGATVSASRPALTLTRHHLPFSQ